jgi:type VI secretion system protein ImpA
MSVIDVSALLLPVSEETPCGEDLEYSGLMDLDRAAQGSAEQELGSRGADDQGKRYLVAAREPNWAEVRDQALELTQRTRDLRVVLVLIRALVRTDGFRGLRDGLAVLRGTVEQFWDCVFPLIDPDDQDPTFRVNTLASLDDLDTMLRPLREAPLVSSPAFGRFSLRDLAVARGEVTPSEGTEPPTQATIEAAFSSSDLEDLQERLTAIEESVEHVRAIDAVVTEKLGAGAAQGLEKLPQLLREARRVLGEQLARRGVGGALAEEGSAAAGGGESPGARTAGGAPLTGEVSSREDVLRALDRVCEYYRRQEPSSPVPVLLERAKRLVGMDFLAIIKDLAPTGLHEVETIRGPTEEQ